MGDSARTAIRQALQNIVNNEITTSNEYNFNYKTGTMMKSPEEMEQLPYVNIDYGREECANKEIGNQLVTGGNRQLLHNSFTVIFDIFLNNHDDPILTQEKALADFKKYFGNNYYVPNDGGTRTVFNCIYSASEMWGLNVDRPNCGITIEFMLWYRQSLIDPEILA